MKMKRLICDGCGGIIDRNTLICNSCGVAYKLDDEYMQPIRVMEYAQKVETLIGRVSIPDYLVRGADEKQTEDLMEMTLHEMAAQMTKKIMPLIELRHEFEPSTCEYVTYGRLKVANPHTTQQSYKEIMR